MADVQGQWDPKFDDLPRLIQSFIDSGEELGLSLAVDVNGKSAVDIWAGFQDVERSRPWQSNTITNIWSSTKTVAALAALLLIDRGILDVNAKVSKYWPEFAANGKADVEVRHILSHTSGVSGWDEKVTYEDICDIEKSSKLLATQAPWWEPGTASGYHSLTYGHLISQLVHKSTGKTLKEFIAEEISGPTGSDFQLGALEKDWSRVTNLVPPPPLEGGFAFPPDSLGPKTLFNPVPYVPFIQTATWRNAEIGGANGHSNAQALVRIMSKVTTGGDVNGKRFLSQETTDLIFKEQARGVDVVLGMPLRFGVGFGLIGNGDTFPDSYLPSGRVCYWGGWGGSMVLLDFDRKITISYVMNKMSNAPLGNEAFKAYIKAIYQALGGSKI